LAVTLAGSTTGVSKLDVASPDSDFGVGKQVDGAGGGLARSDPGPDLLFEVLTVRVAFLALEDSDYVTGGSVMH